MLNNQIILLFTGFIFIPFVICNISFLGIYLYWSCTPDLIPWWRGYQKDVEAQSVNARSKENIRFSRNMKAKKPSVVVPATDFGPVMDHLYI